MELSVLIITNALLDFIAQRQLNNVKNKSSKENRVNLITNAQIQMYVQTKNALDMVESLMGRSLLIHWLAKEDSMIELFKLKLQ